MHTTEHDHHQQLVKGRTISLTAASESERGKNAAAVAVAVAAAVVTVAVANDEAGEKNEEEKRDQREQVEKWYACRWPNTEHSFWVLLLECQCLASNQARIEQRLSPTETDQLSTAVVISLSGGQLGRD